MGTVQPNFFFDPIGYLREGAERTAAQTPEDELGQRNPGFLNDIIGNLTGATDVGTQAYIDKAEDVALKNKYKKQLEEVGGTFNPNLTEGQTRRELQRLQGIQKQEDFKTSPLGLEFAERQRISDANLAESRAQNAITNKRLDNQMEMARLDRADAMDINRAELEFRRDTMMLEDQRYNERLEREFQLRRKESMMAMMQGLASLGAAFAA